MKARLLLTCVLLVVYAGCAAHVRQAGTAPSNNNMTVYDVGIVVRNGEGGLLVRSVVPGLPAMGAGIQAKDLILSVDGKKITNKEFVDLIIAKKAGDRVLITLQRNNDVLKFDIDPVGTSVAPSIVKMRQLLSEEQRIALAVVVGQVKNALPGVPGSWEDVMRTSLQGAYERTFARNFGEDKKFSIVDRVVLGYTVLEYKINSTGILSDDARMRTGAIARATHIMLVNFACLPSGKQSIEITDASLIDVENGTVLAVDHSESPVCR